MPKISKIAIKRIIKDTSGVMLNDRTAVAIADILEKRARDIAENAVANAKRKNRSVILEEDIEDYTVKHS
jgi:histone H3/H4